MTTRRANHFGLSEVLSSPRNKNISLNTSGKSLVVIRPSHPTRGVAHVTNARWDAMDATASGARGIAGRVFPCERSAGARTNGAANRLDETGRIGARSGESFGEAGADGEIVWSWRPDAGVKSCGDASGPTGLATHLIFARRWWQESPVTREITYK